MRLPESMEDPSHFVFLENQLFRKTYVTAKKEVDEWLRAPSYVKAYETRQQQRIDTEENEFITQLQGSTGWRQSQTSSI